MTKYVAGFLFSENRQSVLLIKKTKPEWQKGFLNGVGGKIEDFDKTPLDAMIREFKEETNLDIKNWDHAVTLTGIRDNLETYSVEFFYAVDESIFEALALTEEKLEITNTFDLPNNVIFNLRWLIPLCLDNTLEKPVNIFDIQGN